MYRSFQSSLTVCALLAACSTGTAGSLPEGKGRSPNLTVRLSDYAGTSAKDLAEMTAEAKRVLAKAGIPSIWLNCRFQSPQQSDPGCKLPRASSDIVLRIVPGNRATRKRFGLTGLGFSVVADQSGFLATVIMSRVNHLAKGGLASRGQILGFAAAHEIGHLLLSKTSHSLAGIMQAHWDSQSLVRIARGSLLFTEQESLLMRRNLNRRAVLPINSKLTGELTASKLKITILIYDYADIPRKMLSRATEAATTVFKRAGVETAWLDCTARAAERSDGSSCAEYLGPTHLVLRILPRSMAKRVGLHHSHFGFALPTDGDGFGYIANLFYHRVLELARSRADEERPIILGHMLAHEMGHLLLGLGSHSDTGIMHVPWDGKQLDQVRFNNLRFTSKQVKQIRQQVSDRLAAE